MAFKFKFDETTQKGFRRIGRDQLEIALAEVGSEAVHPVAVHNCRKAMKRLRALVRLCAPALGKGKARRHNAALRDIARLLSSHRDQAVLLQTLSKLKAESGRDGDQVLAPLDRAWGAQSDASTSARDADVASRIRLLLLKESKRLAAARLKGRSFDVIRDGLKASYRQGRTALRDVRDEPSDETFHELRKAVQTHWRQMSLLTRAWPEAIGARVAAARELSQILGDDHDIAMFFAAAGKSKALTADELASIRRLCRNHQTQLRRTALAQADRLFAEKPAAFADRVAAYWRASGVLKFFETVEKGPAASKSPPQDFPTAVVAMESSKAPETSEATAEGIPAPSSATPVIAARAGGKSSSQRRA